MNNIKIVKNGRINRKKCMACGQLIKRERKKMLDTPDVKKMLKIIKKYKLTQTKLANIIGISQGTIQGWFFKSTNIRGKIKPLYFEVLQMNGYK